MSNMWEELKSWEQRNNALVFGVMTMQEVREELSYWSCFDSEYTKDEYYICDTDDMSEVVILKAMDYAYNVVEYQDYQAMIECVGNWLADYYRDYKEQVQQEFNFHTKEHIEQQIKGGG